MISGWKPLAAAWRRRRLRLTLHLSLATVLAWACTPSKSSGPIVAPSPSAFPAHAAELRIGLIGTLGRQNVWALFSGEGYSYNDYAVRARYWPRLYELSIPDQDFEPRLAAGMPTPIHPEGAFHTATIPIRTDLLWSDGTAFSARDAAFTVNTALEFGLGFDWGDFYDAQALDHAEADSPDALVLFFKTQPGVEAFQLGALQGPVVQAAFWAPKLEEAAALLPSAESYAKIQALKEKTAALQATVNRLYAATLTAQGEQARQLQADLRRQQGNLDEASNDLTKDQAGNQDALKAARSALFQTDDADEPLLGPWLPGENRASSADATNRYNPAYPGPQANFDRTTYRLYPSAEAAQQALAADAVNLVLDPAPGSPTASPTAMTSPSHSVRFLVLNPNSAGLADATLRRALACLLDQTELALQIGNAVELPDFIPTYELAWHASGATLPCAGMDASARLAGAVGILKTEGFRWEREPGKGQDGQGLTRPDGGAVPAMRILAPSSDEQRAAAATYVSRQAATLGIQLDAAMRPADEVDYAVLSSGDFDAAVLGWHVGAYPGYLCGWFGAGAVFSYNPSVLPSLCGELQASSSLEDARGCAFDIQRALVEELPMVPLYSAAVRDELRGITYPFGSVVGGLAGVYGAPELAMPSAP